MTVRELREKYLAFFESKGHRRFPSGSLIPYDVTGRLDESLLFNGAGMVQFKPYFRGIAKPEHPRLTNCQKCVRTNDIEEVGDATHLSFFEMLGNFSFGDYFKEEAIRYSWEFLTAPEWLGLDPARLSFTVFEEDDEAERVWRECGARHVFRLGEDTNYWPAGAFSKGPPGPCGPNSEMFYWAQGQPPQGEYSRERWIEDDAAGRWVEIWNDVFIQYEWQGSPDPSGKGYVKEAMPELPFRSIDTGMGLDRTAFVLAGKRSVYENGSFDAIFRILNELTGDGLPYATDESARGQAARVIADHIRNVSFCIADGILPGNTGRGYVVRRLIRRAVLKGQRTLGLSEPFLWRVFEGVVEAMGDHYGELEERRATVVETLRNEEEAFRRTLRAGAERLQALLGKGRVGGEDAFLLYSTYGFPLEVTQELAAEAGIEVDVEGYEAALKADQLLARGAQGERSAYGGLSAADEQAVAGAPEGTEFLGYETTEGTGRVVRVRPGMVALDRTPFYGESGGQVGDTGWLTLPDGSALTVEETTKAGGTHWHRVDAVPEGLLGQAVHATVHTDRRRRIRAHHTGTHLLHLALREALGSHATQAGSYVGPDRLRFDFTHGAALTMEERELIERRVNELALANPDVTTYVDISPEEARRRGAMALFGEKYGNRVRMVEVGPSRELCGGTHVRTAAEVLPFRLLSETSAGSGVRRIEAVAGEAALELGREESHRLQAAASLLKASPAELVPAVERALAQAREERQKRERAERQAMSGGSTASAAALVGPVRLQWRDFGDADAKLAAEWLDNVVAQDTGLVGVVATHGNGKVQFAAKAGAEAVKAGAHAGNLVREVAKVAGGGGGGRPDFATAGGRDATKVAEALAAAEGVLRAAVGG